MSANVYLYKAGNTPSCWAVMSSGSVFRFSQTIWATSTVGPQKIAVASQNNWGGELEANQAVTARSLDFVCSLPGADISGNTYLYGYKVKICQTNTGCSDGLLDHDDGVDSREGLTYVQTSGFECSPQEIWDAPYIRRSLDGIAAVSSATFGPGVFCPITPPADDSYEHHRATSQTRVYYKGGSTSSDCVQNRTCPECYLEWWDRDGNLYQSAQFVVSPFQGYVMQATDPGGASNPANMGTDVQAGMLCWLPPGVTLNGINAVMSLTRVSGGI
jgi:hypothetical protein